MTEQRFIWESGDVVFLRRRKKTEGGQGSGHFGHSGREGEVGGSEPSDGESGFKAFPESNSGVVRFEIARDATTLKPDDVHAEERAAAAAYKGVGYEKINQSCRTMDPREWDELAVRYVNGLESLIEKSEINSDCVLYRSVGRKITSLAELAMAEGGVFRDDGFVSVSVSQRFATSFKASGTVCKILVPKGTKGFCIGTAMKTYFDSEGEIVLARGLTFKPVKIEEVEQGDIYPYKTKLITLRIVQANKSDTKWFDDVMKTEGGSGSGNFGHAGIPGHQGGSAPGISLDDVKDKLVKDRFPFIDVKFTKNPFNPDKRDLYVSAPSSRRGSDIVAAVKRLYPGARVVDSGMTNLPSQSPAPHLLGREYKNWVKFNVEEVAVKTEGGPGSGFFGHAGRPGEVGGSAPAGAGAGEQPPAHLHMKYAFKYRVGEAFYRQEKVQRMYENKVAKVLKNIPAEDQEGLTKITCVDPSTIDAALETTPGSYALKAAAVYEDTQAQIFVNLPFFGAVNVAHEVGHHVWYKQLHQTDISEWFNFHKKSLGSTQSGRVYKAPSHYAKQDKEELFAESYAHYHASPATRARLDPSFRAWFDHYYERMGIKLNHDEQLREFVAERAHDRFYRQVGNFDVWLVDGDYIRAGIDGEFGSFGQPERFRFIPKTEMWIDKRGLAYDYPFYVDHLVCERRLMERKLGYQEAVEAAERLARSERKRASRLHAEGHSRPLSGAVYVEELVEEGDCRVVLVDGAMVRELCDPDFTLSGNDYVYARFIPAGEVWIDDRVLTEDIDFYMLHELWERSLLAMGIPYDQAHREALAVEEDARLRPNEKDWWLNQAIAKNVAEGGPGSGYFGHAGRPGEVGGSAPPDAATLATDKFSKDKISGRITVLGKRVRPEDELNARKKSAYEIVTNDMKRIPEQDLIGLKRLHVVTRQTLINMERNKNPYLSEDQAASAGIFRMANRTIYVVEDYVGPQNTTVLHEIGHSVEMRIFGWGGFGAGEEVINRNPSLPEERKKLVNDWSKLYEEGGHFPTEYSKTNRAEFFAECYARYWKNQQTRDELSGSVQDWFKRFYKSRKLSSDFKPEYKYAGVTYESLEEGGKGSGNFGHAGRPGEVGGSASSSLQVGITSYRPGGSVHLVYRKMEKFRDGLKSIPGVRDVNVRFGSGIYGEAEPTWVVAYKGNGEAMRYIARTAQDNDQDAVLVFRASRGKDASPMTEFEFEDKIDIKIKKDIVDFLTQRGMGMTWFKRNGRAAFFIASIPQFGNDSRKTLEGINELHKLIGEKGVKIKRRDVMISSQVMTKSPGSFSYDSVLRGM